MSNSESRYETGPMVRPWGRVDIARVAWQIGIVAALLTLVYRDEFRRLVFKWWNNPDWSHGFLVPVMSVVFVYLDRRRLRATPVRPSAAGAVLLLVAVGSYLASILLQYGYPKSVSVVIAIYGLVLWQCGWRVLRVVWFPIFFLLFAMPLPERLYVQLTLPLRLLSSFVSAHVLSTVMPSLDAVAEGTVIQYIDGTGKFGQLDVERACAGMRLIVAFGALGTAMAYLAERPIWHRLVLVLSILPIAIFCNIVRVTTTGLLVVNGHEALASGTAHGMLGVVMLGVAFGLFSLVSYVLRHLFIDEQEEAAGAPSTGAAMVGPDSRIET